MDWSEDQLRILDQASRKANPAYLRIRAIAVWHVTQRRTFIEAALYTRTTRQSVSKWVRDFRQHGLDGLKNRAGRGKRAAVNHEDLIDYIYQSPRDWGLDRTRWTLKLLAEKVPSLKGFSRPGVLKVLNKIGIGYKRGQPHLLSPDPEYLEKKRRSKG